MAVPSLSLNLFVWLCLSPWLCWWRQETVACWQVHATKLPSAHVHTNTHTYTHAHTKQASPVLRRLPLSYQSVSQRDVAALQFKQLMQRETLSHSPASPHSPRTLPPTTHTHAYTCTHAGLSCGTLRQTKVLGSEDPFSQGHRAAVLL